MIMRAEDVFDRLTGESFDLRDNRVMIPVELVIDEDEALVRHVNCHIAAIALDFIKVFFNPVDLELRGLIALILGVSHPPPKQEQQSCGNTQRQCPIHAGQYIPDWGWSQ